MAEEEIVVDLREYKDRSGATVPDGRYVVQVSDVEFTTAQSSGAKMIVLFLKILGGEYEGNTIIDRLTQTENALFRTVNFMRAIKLPTPNKMLRLSRKTLLHRVLEVDLEEGDAYRGQTRSEVRGYLPHEGGARNNGRQQQQQQQQRDPWEPPEDVGDGMEEFAPETTQNPAPDNQRTFDRVKGGQARQQAMPAPEGDQAEDIEELDLEELNL